MATSLAQVFSEARSLVTKLHEREKAADGMVSHAHSLNEKINCMKEYKEDLYELNDVAHQKPRTALVHNLQQENRQIRLLQEENRQLKLALEDHQGALELIMQRYRQQMLKIMQLSKIQKFVEKALTNAPVKNDRPETSSKLAYDFGRVFDECLKLGEEASHRDQEEIARLNTENKLLRTLLRAAGINDPRAEELFAHLKDITVQLDGKKKVNEEADENSTPTADRSPEEEVVEATSSTAAPAEKPKSEPPPGGKTSVKVKASSVSSTEDSKSSVTEVKKKTVRAVKPPGPATPTKTKSVTGVGGGVSKMTTGKPVVVSASKTVTASSKVNGNNNSTNTGNSGVSISGQKKVQGVASKTVSGAIKRSSSLGTNPVDSIDSAAKGNSPKKNLAAKAPLLK